MNKKLIRTNCFETNSSSSHSISICDKYLIYDTISPNSNGEIKIYGQDFGWGFDKYNDPEIKAAYALTDSNNVDLIVDVIKEQTGAEKVTFIENGYIDHQSTGTFSSLVTGTLEQKKEIIRNFIFNKNSWLFIDNDNGGDNEEDYYVTKYRKSGSYPPIIRYKLEIENIGIIKFLTKPTKSEIIDKINDYFQTHYIAVNIDKKIVKNYDYKTKYYTFYHTTDNKYIEYDKNRIILKKETDTKNFYYNLYIKFELIKC